MNQKPTPQTEHEWTIHALNIHGAFFERWCAATIAAAEGWSVLDTRVPVEHPSGSPRTRAAESEIDVVAQTLQNARHIELLVEAKKNNPEFVRWVFFGTIRQRALGARLISSVVNTGGLNASWMLRSDVVEFSTNAVVVDEGREVRGNYLEAAARGNQRAKPGDLTKTSNNAIWEAAYQVAVAVQARASDEIRRWHCRPTGPRVADRPARLFVPVIVTTASLDVCAFEAPKVVAESGELAYADAGLTPSPWVLYEYGLSRHLQVEPESWPVTPVKQREVELVARMPIFVVNAGHLVEFLGKLRLDYGFLYIEDAKVHTALPEDVRNR